MRSLDFFNLPKLSIRAMVLGEARGSLLVKALGCKPEGRGFEIR
jgi:hypothetical protein